MPIYTKKASEDWKRAFREFESISGFEIMFQEDIDSGKMTPYEVWDANIRWLEDVVNDATNIRTPSDFD